MPDANLVSVIIPSYNHEKYVIEAVRSVLEQTWHQVEVIVVDDGSSDGSLRLLRQITDPRVRVLEQSNAGAHSAINRGLSEARGTYLAILNSDDAFHPDRLATSVALLRSGHGMVTSWIEIIDQRGRSCGIKHGWRNLPPWPLDAAVSAGSTGSQFLAQLAAANFIATTSNMVFTREAFEAVGPFRPLRFVHDWDFAIRAALLVKCTMVERPMLRYRTHTTNTIGTDRPRMLFEICWVFARHLSTVVGRLHRSGAIASDCDAARWMARAINPQGCDGVIWKLLALRDASGDGQAVHYLDRLLSDAQLCDALVAEIASGSR